MEVSLASGHGVACPQDHPQVTLGQWGSVCQNTNTPYVQRNLLSSVRLASMDLSPVSGINPSPGHLATALVIGKATLRAQCKHVHESNMIFLCIFLSAHFSAHTITPGALSEAFITPILTTLFLSYHTLSSVTRFLFLLFKPLSGLLHM